MKEKSRKIIYKSGLAVVYVLLLVLMFTTGRTHTLLVDNKSAQDGSCKAINGMEVTVNKEEPVEFYKGDRDKFTVKGQSVKLHVEFFDGKEDLDVKLRIPLFKDTMIVSIPMLQADLPDAFMEFKN